jgi:hypothetical protein
MPQPIKMKIKLQVIIFIVSAVGRATVSVMCFTRTGRSSTTGTTHLFLPQKVNFSENKFNRFFFIYIHEYEIEYFITLRSKNTKRK